MAKQQTNKGPELPQATLTPDHCPLYGLERPHTDLSVLPDAGDAFLSPTQKERKLLQARPLPPAAV